MKNLIIALLLMLLVISVLLNGAHERDEMASLAPPAWQADYSRCITVRNGPLIKPKAIIHGLHNHPEIS